MHHATGYAPEDGLWDVFPVGPPPAPVPPNASPERLGCHLRGHWKKGAIHVQGAQVVLWPARHVVFQLRIAGTLGVRLRSTDTVSVHYQSGHGATRNRTGRGQFHVRRKKAKCVVGACRTFGALLFVRIESNRMKVYFYCMNTVVGAENIDVLQIEWNETAFVSNE